MDVGVCGLLREEKKRKRKEGRERECWESRKSEKEKGNRKIKREKQKNLLCGLNVGIFRNSICIFMSLNNIY